MESGVKKVQINLSIKPSKDLGKKLVITLFDHLLHSRSQIPFHFELFKKFIEKKTALNTGDKILNEKQDWKTEKQLKLAEETYEKVCALKKVKVSCFAVYFSITQTSHFRSSMYNSFLVFPSWFFLEVLSIQQRNLIRSISLL